MRKIKVEKDYYDLAESRGLKWLGKKLPKNIKIKTLWECEKGHKFKTRYNTIQQGHGCPTCAVVSNRLTRQDYYNVGKNSGILWVSLELPKNVRIKTLWKCKKGHVFSIGYNSIQQGGGCPICSKDLQRKTKKDYYIVGQSKGITWTGGELPKNTHYFTLWQCPIGHELKTSYVKIQQGMGCRQCIISALRNTEQDYYTVGKDRGILWIGHLLPNHSKEKTLWECKNRHQWETTYGNIKAGCGCPYCQDIINGCKVSKPQRKLNNLLCGSLNYPEAKYRIDVVIMRNSQKIAVEYDCWYWHKGREEHDAKRDKYLISRGWKVLHVKSGELLPTRKQLKKAINKLLNGEDLVNIYLDDWKV